MVKLGEICTINMGQSPSSSSYNCTAEGLPFFQGNADFGDIYPTIRIWCNNPIKIAEKDDILISVRAPIGALNIANQKCCIGRGLASLTNYTKKIYKDYLWFALYSKIEELNSKGTGSTFKAISKKILSETDIPLPSLEKQTQIAKQLTCLDTLLSRKKQQLSKLDQLIKSRFIEMFGDPITNEKQWNKVPLSSCLESIDSGKSFVCKGTPRQGNWPAILKLSAVTYGSYHPEENKAMLDESQYIANATVRAGDLLFTRKNTPELVGMCAYVYDTPEKLMIPDIIFRLNTKSICNKIYLCNLINHDLFRTYIKCIATGSSKSMSNISKERLLKQNIILPPIILQNKFSNFIQYIENLKHVINQSLNDFETLKKSLMQEYFG